MVAKLSNKASVTVRNEVNLDAKRFAEYDLDGNQSLDFEEFLNNNQNKKNLIFLDPPYYLEKSSKLYGNNGDMHDTFEHKKLYKCLLNTKNWFMTYNNCEYKKIKAI